MIQLSNISRSLCGISLLTVPAIEYGGVLLLGTLVKREGRVSPARRRLTRTGHAHAGALLMLSLICQMLVDSISLTPGACWFIRIGLLIGSLLVPMGFVLATGAPPSKQPEGAIQIVFAGDFIFAVCIVTLGVELLLSACSHSVPA
jgi:hypothetical protein